jgi:thiamine-monophosphate kinase
VSDGLLQDLGHVCEASGVGAEIELERLPIDAATREAAAQLGLDAIETAAGTGDDYQLIACAPPDAKDGLCARLPTLTEIGRIVAGSGVAAMRAGRPYEPKRRGYEHGTKE